MADDMARLINFTSNVFCATISLLSFLCLLRFLIAFAPGAAGWCERLKTKLLWRQQLGVALWVSCGAKWWLDVRPADGGERMSWLMSRHQRRSTAAGVGDLLWLQVVVWVGW